MDDGWDLVPAPRVRGDPAAPGTCGERRIVRNAIRPSTPVTWHSFNIARIWNIRHRFKYYPGMSPTSFLWWFHSLLQIATLAARK